MRCYRHHDFVLFRYPGSKGRKKFHQPILREIAECYDMTAHRYCEPFFGSGSIGVRVIENMDSKDIWFNDIDAALCSLWNSIITDHERLKRLIFSFKPDVGTFYAWKDELMNTTDDCSTTIGFKKLAVHQMSYSGLGVKAGGPIGGTSQTSAYAVDCRWNPGRLIGEIDRLHDVFSTVQLKHGKITTYDFRDVLNGDSNVFYYIDAPYYLNGNSLYKHGFTYDDHEELAEILRNEPYWVVSYDDCKEIRKMYSWAKIRKIDVTYTISGVSTNTELIISPSTR